jgi:cysteine desulfurase/selenocysteine lyase
MPPLHALDDRPRAASSPAEPATPSSAFRPSGAFFNVEAIRRDFPILNRQVHGHPLVWFDNAATTHKPQAVVDRLVHFYTQENSNVHRSAHALAVGASDAYDEARETVRKFIGAPSAREVVFTRGTTEAINLVAKSWGAAAIGAGDEILVTGLEHHANIVPWQQLAADKGAVLRVAPVDDTGQVRLDAFQGLLNERTRLVGVTQVSNALGTELPVKEIIRLARARGARTLVDGAQSVSHLPVNVQALDADFFAFSGHKVFGPMGIGVLYAKRELLEGMQPWQSGGNMIRNVSFEASDYGPAPARFEAGTGSIADAVGLAAALDYVSRIGIENIHAYESALLRYATAQVGGLDGVRLIGTAANKASVLSFVVDGFSPTEIGEALNRRGIAVRTGHHCAQPSLRRFGLEASVRVSLAFYNTAAEVDSLVQVLRQLTRSRSH